MNNYRGKLILILVIWLLMPSAALQAAPVDYVPAGQVIEGPLLLAGERVRIDGIVDGDVYAAGNNISVTGEVKGDIIAAAQNITVAGNVQGDLRLAAQNVRLQGVTSGSSTIFCQFLDFNRQAVMERDMLVLSNSCSLEGNVQRNLKGSMQTMYLSGTIGQDVELFDVGQLELAGAEIGGDLLYRSFNKAVIAPGTLIGGEEHWTESIKPSAPPTTVSYGSMIGSLLIKLAGLLIVWGVLGLWRPGFWQQLTQPARNNPLGSTGIGLLLLLATPLLTILLLVTVIGIPAGFLVLAVYSIALYLSILVAAQYLTELLKPRINYSAHDIWLVLVILLVLLLAVKIPYGGWIIGMFILSLGLGSIFRILFPGSKRPEQPEPV